MKLSWPFHSSAAHRLFSRKPGPESGPARSQHHAPLIEKTPLAAYGLAVGVSALAAAAWVALMLWLAPR